MFHLLYISSQTCKCSWSVFYLLTDAGGLCIRLFFLLGLCKLHKAPGFTFIMDAATGIPQSGPALTGPALLCGIGGNSTGILELGTLWGICEVDQLDGGCCSPSCTWNTHVKQVVFLVSLMTRLGVIYCLGLHVALLVHSVPEIIMAVEVVTDSDTNRSMTFNSRANYSDNYKHHKLLAEFLQG